MGYKHLEFLRSVVKGLSDGKITVHKNDENLDIVRSDWPAMKIEAKLEGTTLKKRGYYQKEFTPIQLAHPDSHKQLEELISTLRRNDETIESLNKIRDYAKKKSSKLRVSRSYYGNSLGTDRLSLEVGCRLPHCRLLVKFKCTSGTGVVFTGIDISNILRSKSGSKRSSIRDTSGITETEAVDFLIEEIKKEIVVVENTVDSLKKEFDI